MSNEIHCPVCDSRDVTCVEKPHHNHICHACGYSMLGSLHGSPVPTLERQTDQ